MSNASPYRQATSQATPICGLRRCPARLLTSRVKPNSADALITVDAALRRGVTREQLDAQVERLVGVRARRAAAAVDAGDPASESSIGVPVTWSRHRTRPADAAVNIVIRRGGRRARVDELWVGPGVVGVCDGRLKYRKETGSPDALWLEKQRQDLARRYRARSRSLGLPRRR